MRTTCLTKTERQKALRDSAKAYKDLVKSIKEDVSLSEKEFRAQVEKDGKPNGELHELIPCGKLCSAQDTPELFFGIMAPWNRVYRKSLFTEHNIEFATKVWYEDIRVVTKINAVARSAVRLPKAYYHYLQREGSAMNNKNSERNGEIIATGEGYKAKASCLNGIDSIRRNAPDAEVVQ